MDDETILTKFAEFVVEETDRAFNFDGDEAFESDYDTFALCQNEDIGDKQYAIYRYYAGRYVAVSDFIEQYGGYGFDFDELSGVDDATDRFGVFEDRPTDVDTDTETFVDRLCWLTVNQLNHWIPVVRRVEMLFESDHGMDRTTESFTNRSAYSFGSAIEYRTLAQFLDDRTNVVDRALCYVEEECNGSMDDGVGFDHRQMEAIIEG